MKILLIYPFFLSERIHLEEIQAPPLGLYYVGSALRSSGHDVEIINFWDSGNKPALVRETLLAKKPDLIGFSVLNANRMGAISIARLAKDLDPRVTVVFGGIGATFLWEHILSHFPYVDYIILGEGELTFCELAAHIDRGEKEAVCSLKGVAFRAARGPVKRPSRALIEDLDCLPDPAQYFDFNHVSSSRGCPWDCSFCGSPMFWGRRVRFHSPEYFVNQLEMLHSRGINFFYFSDDTFTLKKERVINICRLIIERNLKISWFAISRVNYVDEDILYWMRRAGCTQISYGVESGSIEIRKTLNKQIDEESIVRAFSLTSRYGILPRAYFIYGSPGENWQTILQSIELMIKIRPLSAIFYILDIFPGTSLYEDYKKRTGATDDLWINPIEDIMYHETDDALDRELILAFGETLRNSFWQHLVNFVESLDLIDLPELYPFHADFLSRLAMTFSHGDYSGNKAIAEKEKIAESLFKRALTYHHDHRAYLGLAILCQKQGRHEDSIYFASGGLGHFPQSDSLRMCLGITYMNLGRFRDAMESFSFCRPSPEVEHYMAVCRNAHGFK
ncbi:MAG: radical SAM protein [Desulfobacteraceae bacterium]|nr:MAG: radical SAM protein [Desulfobacteraceae bacterium]